MSRDSAAAADLTLGSEDSLTIDYGIADCIIDLENGTLQLEGATKLLFSNCGEGDGRYYTLLTGVSALLDKDGNELTLNSSNNNISKYFDTAQPGTGFWANSTLQLTSDGLLRLVRHNQTVKNALTITSRRTNGASYRYYKGVSFENITFSSSSYARGGAIYGGSSTIELSNNGSVTFSGNTASSSSSSYARGGAIYGGSSSTITLSDNGSVTFSGNTADGLDIAYGGAIYGGSSSTITLSDNGSVTFSGNTADGRDAYGGAIYGDSSTITLSNNGSVMFSGNTASSYASYSTYGGAICGDGSSTITLSENGSVEFSGNTADGYDIAYGGAIYGDDDSTITLSDNGSVTFSGNTASSYNDAYACGGAIYGANNSTIELSGNEIVTFSGNTASSSSYSSSSSSYAYGGAIYGGSSSTITLSGNGSVTFSGNTADDDDVYGGAIYGGSDSKIELSNNGSVTFIGNTADGYDGARGSAIYGGSDSTITLSDNGSVTFSGNTADGCDGARGGAIYGGSDSTITLSNNGSVTFSENSASSSYYYDNWAYGGAIYGDDDSTITLSGNESVTFNGNKASSSSYYSYYYSSSYGGAIYGGSSSTIELSGNGNVTFIGNTADDYDGAYGGAIYGYYSTITLSENGSVTFSGNTASFSDNDNYAYGGAIYAAYGNLNIRNNDSVLFEKNAEVENGTYRLRSIVAGGGSGDVISLSAAAGKSIEFRDSVYIDSRSTVNLNADYTDDEGVVHKQTGDIIFTGAYTEQHLNELLADAKASRAATAEEILNSRTTEVCAMTNLYGGRLRVEDGAIYKGYGITAHEGSAATVLVKDATLNHAGYDLVFHAGTTLELVGANAASANHLQMHTGSSLVFRENASMALDGLLNLHGTGTLLLEDGNLSAQKIDGTGGISITGGRLELQDDTDALAVDGAVSISNTTLSGNWCGEGLTVDGVSVAADAEISLNNLTIKSVLSNEGTLVLGGEVSIAREDFGPAGGDVQYSAGSSGYRYVAHGYTLVEGSGQSSAAADAKWLITENGAEQDYQSYSYTDGVLTAYIERDITTYWVNSEVTYDGRSEFDTANTLVLNGGDLTLAAALGDNLSGGIRVVASGTLSFAGDLRDSFTGTISLQRGTLHMTDPLIISKGRELVVTKDSTLDTTLCLRDGRLSVDFAGSGAATGLNSTNLHLSGGTELQLLNAGNGDGRVYDLFTDVFGLNDANGNALVLSADNNAAALYFDAERPGTGFWKNATLQLTDDGTLQLVRYTDITIPTGYARTLVMDEPSDFTRYAGLTQDVAFRLAADVTFDASAAVMTNLAASRYFTSASADATAAIAFRNTENRMFYVKENETLIMKALRAVTFEDLAVSADEAISGGAIYVSDNSGITLEDNGAVIFSGTTLTANGAEAQGGALYAGAASPVVLNGNGSVEFLENSVVGSSSYGGTMYADSSVLLSNNNGVIFRDNSSVTQGGAIYAGAELTLTDNGSVEFSGNTSGQGGAIDAAADVVLSTNGGISFRENMATSGSGAAIYTTGAVSLIDNGSVEFSGNTAVTGGGAIYGSTATVSGNQGSVVFSENTTTSGSGAAIYTTGDVVLTDNGSVEFSGNTAVTGGGAIYGSTATVSGNQGSVVFSENTTTSGSGAAIYTTGDVVLTDNGSVEFSGNTAVTGGGAIYGSTATVSGNQGSVVFSENTTTSGSGAAIYTTGDVVLTDNGSVEFSGNTASSNGGAVYGSQVTVSGNQDAVVFSGNTATGGRGAAIYATGAVSLTDNGSVEFSGNTAVTGGGAIYGRTITVSDNIGAVSFIGNVSESSGSSSSLGGAIYGSSQVTFSGNNSVVFKENSAYYRGGAIYTPGTVRLSGNGSVEFRDNVASVYEGGAIYAKTVEISDNAGGVVFTGNKAAMDDGGAIYASSSIILTGNGSVEFSENTASYGGGAIWSSATVTINNHADAVLFRGNTTSSSSYGGGAVYANSGVTLSHNGSVEFAENSTAYRGGAVLGNSVLRNNGSVEFCANSSVGYGGAIYTSVSVTIAGNDEVTFARNVEKSGSIYRLRSLYLAGDSSTDKLSLSAGKGQSISFYDSVYMGAKGSVALNADYTDADGVTQKANGIILFSGATTEEDLKNAKVGVSGTEEEILNSRTSELNSAATLYGGTLQVQDKAVLKLNSGLTVAEGSNASVKVRAAEVNLGNNALELTSGSLVELQNGASLSLSELTVAAGAELKAGGYIAPVAEAAKPVAFSLEGIESDTPIVNTGSVNHVEGNLRLSGGSTLNLQDSYLTVSGDLVLDVTNETEKVVVELTPGIAKDELSQVVLFEVGGTVTFGENGTASDSEVVYYQFAEDYFTGDWISQDTWLVYDRNTNLVYLEGVNIIAAVPEPTSSTLSLLALAALAARRRRK